MSDGLSQSDLDALFGGLSSFGDPPGEPEGELKLEAAWETRLAGEANANKGDIMSQDEIDKMLAMFGK
ncbi:MAG: hypothetical protein C0392_11320 [Syntrophus sp. (in: bacteria)]|nr:hypothetical protein [Syntrophus sp. (in: bacteria)]